MRSLPEFIFEVLLFRKVLEQVSGEVFRENEQDFPSGCCDDASMLLAAYLKDLGFEKVAYIRGSNALITRHDWLEVDDYIVDITADQFSDFGVCSMYEYAHKSVIVCKSSEFHRSLKPRNDGKADFREKIHPSLDRYMKLKRRYELIAKVMRYNKAFKRDSQRVATLS
ncbi:TPA: hypothetical protein RQK43_004389 [Vibrio vulnificus]|nr:hypothetical protein [Vibrio parahaemolyticus]HDY7864589.1 hypothetical protein [Vibrio vulnificus]